ncbi:MAG: hypothetical protein FWC89_06885 [Defluviitaleaceae bacterium]|nr:hypothetical protein [Defluviitaleaceae bacterium]
MARIEIPFTTNNLGRIGFIAGVMTGNSKSFNDVEFKLDSGSDFTTISCGALDKLGYTQEFLADCPFHENIASLAAHENQLKLQYITNVSIKFGNRELQGCRIFFALNTQLRNLLGSDILKYFNWEVNYDDAMFRLTQVKNAPSLSKGEIPLQIYSVEN